MGNTGYAEIVLQNFLKLADDIQTKDRIYFHLVQLHLSEARKSKTGALSRSRDYLSKISESGKIKFNTDQYADLISKAKHAPKKNPKAAGLFAIVPGGGFFYCERYKDAFTLFFESLKINPTDADTFINLLDAAKNSDNVDDAKKIFNAYYKEFPALESIKDIFDKAI